MSINAVQTQPIEKPNPIRNGSGTLAILAALTMIKEALASNQLNMSLSYEKLVEIRVLIQDKLAGEFEKVLEIKKDAISHMNKASIFTAVAVGLFFVSLAVPATGTLAAVKLSHGKTLLHTIGALGGMLSSGYTIAAGDAAIRSANIEEKNQQDKGLIDANEKTSETLADKTAETTKAILKAQEAITKIINAMGAAMRTAAR